MPQFGKIYVMRVFWDREFVRNQDRVNFHDLSWWYKLFVTHTQIFKGFEATFFIYFFYPSRGSAGRESTTLIKKKYFLIVSL